MSTVLVPSPPRPPVRRSRFRWLKKVAIMLVALLVATAGAMWAAGIHPWAPFAGPSDSLTTRVIDRGLVRTSVIESGSLESSDSATVRCMVEAFMGVVGGTTKAAGGTTATAKAATTATSSGVSSSSSASSAASRTNSTAASSSTSGSSQSMATKSAATDSAATATAGAKPTIRSFTLSVAPHSPLRGASATAAAKAKNQGGGASRGGGGGGGGDLSAEKSGSTRILTIVPEGQWVKEGETVCELDSATFRDELQAQRIRWAQAKAFVDQANAILEVSRISLQEYRDGVYPRDLQQIEKYILVCEKQVKQARDNLIWSKEMTDKHYQSDSQLRGNEYTLQQYEIALQEARGMRDRLVNFTAPRLIKNHEAKLAAVQSDVLAQESSFKLEDVRKEKLEQMIAFCTLKAPREGMVAYASETKGGGPRQTTTRIQEGLTVRQGQAIVMLPDPQKVQVRVRVNESKVAQIHVGQTCDVMVEAFPGRPLAGKVTQITAIPAANADSSPDVKLYYAIVQLTQGFSGLRNGLSARVTFRCQEKPDVVRVPLASVRWVEDRAFVAIRRPDGKAFDWRRIQLGLLDRYYAEVVTGLGGGEAIVANPDPLTPAPPSGDSPEDRKIASGGVAGTAG